MSEMRLFLMLLAGVLPLTAHDWLIVPGERIGPVTARSNEALLRAAFGSGNLVRQSIQIEGKVSAPGVVIYQARPEESLAVVWRRQEGDLRWPLLVMPCYGHPDVDCRWRTTSGVRVGATLAELEKMNRKPFRLYPSPDAWTSPRWEDGALARELGEDFEVFLDGTLDRSSYTEAHIASNEEPLNHYRELLRINRMNVFLLSPTRNTPRNDWVIGGRFWSMLATGNVEALRETLGPTQVQRSWITEEEASIYLPAVTIFPDQPDATLRREDGYGTFVCGEPAKCRWKMPGNIPLKMTLSEAQKLNRGPFEFNGFGWDLGGMVRSVKGSGLVRIFGAASQLVVGCDDGYPDRMRGEGVALRSDDPAFASLKCEVLVVHF